MTALPDSSRSAGRRRAIFAAAVGQAAQQYEIGIYSLVISAMVMSRPRLSGGKRVVGFPDDYLPAPVDAALIIGLSIIGAVVLGRLADVRGRRYSLLVSICLLFLDYVLLCVLPTGESAAYLVPPLLLAIRLISAFVRHGEVGVSNTYAVEWAPKRCRGLYSTLPPLGGLVGIVVGFGLPFALLQRNPAVFEWTWRLAPLFGLLLSLLGIYLRWTATEPLIHSPPSAKTTDRPGLPLAARACALLLVWPTSTFVLDTYRSQWMLKHLSSAPFLGPILVGFLALLLVPLFGHLSDRVGRRPILMASCVGFIVLPWPLLSYFAPGSATPAGTLLVQIVLSLLVAAYSGPAFAALAEMFPTSMRMTWLTAAYALAMVVVNGLTSPISKWLTGTVGQTAPVFILAAAAAVSLAVVRRQKETAFDELP